jgi:hypothetical protein
VEEPNWLPWCEGLGIYRSSSVVLFESWSMPLVEGLLKLPDCTWVFKKLAINLDEIMNFAIQRQR